MTGRPGGFTVVRSPVSRVDLLVHPHERRFGVASSRLPGGRLAYERAIRRSSLPAPARHIALTLATWADIGTGLIPDRFQPSLSTLEEATGLGVSTVKRHLVSLEKEGWLVRDRPEIDRARREHARTQYLLRVPDSHQGHGPERAMPRPTAGQGHGPEEAKAWPTAGHKSSSEFLESRESLLSPPPSPKPTAEPAPAPASEERETTAPQDKLSTAQRVVRAAGVVTEDEEQPFIAWATVTHQPRGGAWWRTVAANGDLPDLAAAWRADRPVVAAAPGAPTVPPWCGKCGGEPIAERWIDRDDGRTYRCPDCHPDVAPTWATPARRNGHTPYQQPTDPSAWNRDFSGRPIPASREQQQTDAQFDRAMARAQARMSTADNQPAP